MFKLIRSKIILAAAIACMAAMTLATLPSAAFAFSPEACKQHCAENCPGKGNSCLINCTTRCDRGGRH